MSMVIRLSAKDFAHGRFRAKLFVTVDIDDSVISTHVWHSAKDVTICLASSQRRLLLDVNRVGALWIPIKKGYRG